MKKLITYFCVALLLPLSAFSQPTMAERVKDLEGQVKSLEKALTLQKEELGSLGATAKHHLTDWIQVSNTPGKYTLKHDLNELPDHVMIHISNDDGKTYRLYTGENTAFVVGSENRFSGIPLVTVDADSVTFHVLERYRDDPKGPRSLSYYKSGLVSAKYRASLLKFLAPKEKK